MTRTFTMLLLTAAIACGSKSSASPKTTPSAPPVTAGSDAPKPTEPEKPAAEPVKDDAKPDPKATLLAAETSAWEAAKPAFTKYCATCHTKDGKKAAKKKLDHFDMDTYPLGGHHTSTIGFTIREVLGLASKKATMPYDKPGSVKGDELAAIKAWTDSWEAAEKGGAHPPAKDHD